MLHYEKLENDIEDLKSFFFDSMQSTSHLNDHPGHKHDALNIHSNGLAKIDVVLDEI
jgi:hypothetical protein